MKTLCCSHCRFKWKPRTENAKIPEICGNCGTKGSISIEPDANQILQDSAGMDFRM